MLKGIPEPVAKAALQTAQQIAKKACAKVDRSLCDPEDATQHALLHLVKAVQRDANLLEMAKNPAWLTSYIGQAIRWYVISSFRNKGKIPISLSAGSEASYQVPASDPLADIEALTIFHRIYSAASPGARLLLEALLAGAKTKSELAARWNVQRRTVRKWLLTEVPMLRKIIERVLDQYNGKEAQKLLFDCVRKVSNLLNDPDWVAKGASVQSNDLMIAMKKLRISVGAKKYEEIKKQLTSPSKLVASLIEVRLTSQEIIDVLSLRVGEDLADEAKRNAAKLIFLNALPEIRRLIDEQ